MIKISSLKKVIIYYIFIYMLNKNLWDYLFGPAAKNLYYSVLLVSAAIGIIKMCSEKSKEKKIIVLSFIIYSIVVIWNGIALSNIEQRSVGYIKYLIYPLIFFSVYSIKYKKIDFDQLMDFFMKWAGVTSVLGVYEYIIKKPIIPTSSTRIYVYFDGTSSYRACVFIGSPMILAIVLAVALVVTFYYYHFRKKFIYCGLIILILIGIFVTGSRAPLISAVVGLFIMYYKLEKFSKIGPRTTLTLIWCFCSGLLMILTFCVFPDIQIGIPPVDNIISRFSSVFNFSSEWGNVERLARWSYYIGVFKRNMLTGIGLATTSAEVASNVNVTAHGITTESGVLGHLVEIGLIGSIPYYSFLFSCIYSVQKKTKKFVKQGTYMYFMICGIISLYLIEDVVLQISLDIFGQFIIFFFLALLINFTPARKTNFNTKIQ